MINNEVRGDFNTGVYLNQILSQVEETLRMCMGSIETSIRDAANNGSNAIDVALELNSNQAKNLNVLSEKLKATATEFLNTQKSDFETLKSEIIRNAETVTENTIKKIEENNASFKSEFGETYVAQTDYQKYQNETKAALSENSKGIALNAEKTESIQTELTEYKRNNNAELSVQADRIFSQVEAAFATKNELEVVEQYLSNKVTQEVNRTTEEFIEQVSVLSDAVTDNEGVVSAFIEELNVYIRRGELAEGVYGIEIGRSDSGIVSRFTNDKLSFIQGGIEIAYISGSNLYITRAEVLDYLKIGNSTDGYFTFDVTEHGLEVRWNG